MIEKLTLLLLLTTLATFADDSRKVLVESVDTQTKVQITAQEMAKKRANNKQTNKSEPSNIIAIYKPSK